MYLDQWLSVTIMIIISVNDQYLSDQSPANLNDDTNGTVWTVKSLGDRSVVI